MFEGRLAEPWARWIDLALGGFCQAVHQPDHAVAIDGEIECLAQPDVGPGRARQYAEMIIPDMRRDVVDDPHSGRFELRHRIRRRSFDQVDLSREQRVGSCQRFRHRDQDQLVDFRNPLLVPVIRILRKLGEFARHQFGQFERAGAGRLAGELVPVLAELFILRGAGDQEPEHLVREERVDFLVVISIGGVVDLGVARDRGQPGFYLRALAFVELRRLVVEDLVEIPDHRVGIEFAAVMELDALAKRKAPFGFVSCRRPSIR